MQPILVKRVTLKNYRSIGRCDVDLGPLRFLVGPNGSGKSNFLDALQLVADGLGTTLEQAIDERGGIGSVCTRPELAPFAVGLEIELPGGTARYGFKVGRREGGGILVHDEECCVAVAEGSEEACFVVRLGHVVRIAGCGQGTPPEVASDRLALVAMSGFPPFRSLFDALKSFRTYQLSVPAMVAFRKVGSGEVLSRNGSNLAAVLRELKLETGRTFHAVLEHLQAILPALVDVNVLRIQGQETLSFEQRHPVAPDNFEKPIEFHGEDMSEGTIRALGVLVAALQGSREGKGGPALVGLEEPEMALHPGALEVLLSALRAASERTQIIVTTHSADLLDSKYVSDAQLLAVSANAGRTTIGPIDAASRSALRDRLYSAGELLRMGQLEPVTSSRPDREAIFSFLAE